MGSHNKLGVTQGLAEFRQKNSRAPDEVELMNLIVSALSNYLSSKSLSTRLSESIRHQIELRYRTIANGGGAFGKWNIDPDKYRLELVDFRTERPIAVHSQQSQDSRITN